MTFGLNRWLCVIVLATPLLVAGNLSAQDYVPGAGYIAEDEWYDPSDWFDGNDLETEDYYDGDADAYADDYYYDDYDFDDHYGDGYGDYDNYYTDDWYDDGGDFDDWYDTY